MEEFCHRCLKMVDMVRRDEFHVTCPVCGYVEYLSEEDERRHAAERKQLDEVYAVVERLSDEGETIEAYEALEAERETLKAEAAEIELMYENVVNYRKKRKVRQPPWLRGWH